MTTMPLAEFVLGSLGRKIPLSLLDVTNACLNYGYKTKLRDLTKLVDMILHKLEKEGKVVQVQKVDDNNNTTVGWMRVV